MSLDFSGITLPFTAADLLTGGVALIGVVGSIVLLRLVFRVAPLIISLIDRALAGRGKA